VYVPGAIKTVYDSALFGREAMALLMDLKVQEEQTLTVPAKTNWMHKSIKARYSKERCIIIIDKKKHYTNVKLYIFKGD
jgi:hypothetical protein